ncbi:hypothetical protein [Paraburkholderia azotifigens]|uniref:Uncharacterized protein n=1 Tax=Paraburkholderia azotifigens TaxID=2057004 RepID=A0ABU9R7X9_9BURK
MYELLVHCHDERSSMCKAMRCARERDPGKGAAQQVTGKVNEEVGKTRDAGVMTRRQCTLSSDSLELAKEKLIIIVDDSFFFGPTTCQIESRLIQFMRQDSAHTDRD